MQKSIALFRYHDYPDICLNHLELFRKLNPGIEIHGIYGGKAEDADMFHTFLKLDSNYLLQDVSNEWKWKNFDFALKRWYSEKGQYIPFDRVYLLEWDFIAFKPIHEIYKPLDENEIALSGLVPLKKIERKWHWTANEFRNWEWNTLKAHLVEKFQYNMQAMGCVGPGLSFSRKMLDAMMNIELPELGNDELRFPFYAQLAGFKMTDTGFFRKWFSRREFRYFNCNGFEIDNRYIEKSLKRKRGRRVFHPYRKLIPDHFINSAGI